VFFRLIKPDYEKKQRMEVLDASHKKYKEDLKKLKELFKDKIPTEMLCPITGEIFFDPVMTDDGHSYEKLAIQCWLRDYDSSPVTKGTLKSKTLIPNILLKKLVNDFYDTNQSSLPKESR